MKVFTLCLLLSSSVCLFPQKKDSTYASEVPKPTQSEVRYGKHERNFLDFWKAKSKKPAPVAFIIHGGGWKGGSKERLDRFADANALLKVGISVVAINYRYVTDDESPPVKAPLHDAARALQFIRSKAKEWQINPEKIAALGFSAGGHLTLMTSTTSQTNSYEAIDELDKLPCHVNYAVPVYPAYVLEDGANGANKAKGNNSTIVKDFAFDAKTPSMCLIHGDTDQYSPMNSVAVYHKLRTMNIPAELHIYAKIGHGFGARPTLDGKNDHIGDWLNRAYESLKVLGF